MKVQRSRSGEMDMQHLWRWYVCKKVFCRVYVYLKCLCMCASILCACEFVVHAFMCV